MNFIEAINLLNTDTVKSVRKSSWERGKYIFIDNSNGRKLSLGLDRRDYNGFYLPYSASIDDILDRDWEIYKKETRIHTFEEALKALKNGAKIYRKSRASQAYKKTDSEFLFYSYDDFEANDWIILDN